MPPLPTDSTVIKESVPPPVIVTLSFSLLQIPSFEIVTVPGIPVDCALINVDAVSDSVPLISSPVTKVPTIVSSFKVNSVTSFAPI